MNEAVKDQLKVWGAILAGAATVGTVTYVSLPSAPVAPHSITLTWDCDNARNQTFEFVRKTNLAGPWQFYTNVVGTNSATFPRTQPMELWTIRRTWLTGNTNFVLTQRGF